MDSESVWQGGKRDFKAELQLTEVDPSSKKNQCLNGLILQAVKRQNVAGQLHKFPSLTGPSYNIPDVHVPPSIEANRGMDV